MNKKEINVEYDLFKGNINRMFITNSLDECYKNYMYAKKRLKEIYDYNCHKIIERENKNNEI